MTDQVKQPRQDFFSQAFETLELPLRPIVTAWRQQIVLVPIKDGLVHPVNLGLLIEEKALEVFEAVAAGEDRLAYERITKLLEWLERIDWHDPYDGRLWFIASRLAVELSDPQADRFHAVGAAQLELYGDESVLNQSLQAFMVAAVEPPVSWWLRWRRTVWLPLSVLGILAVIAISWNVFRADDPRQLEPQFALAETQNTQTPSQNGQYHAARAKVFGLTNPQQFKVAIVNAEQLLKSHPQDALIDLARSNARVLQLQDQYKSNIQVLKIGLSGPFHQVNNPNSSQGDAVARGVNLAVQEFNWGNCQTTQPSQGVLSQTALSQRVFVLVDIQVDDATESQAVRAANHFANDPEVLGVVGPTTSLMGVDAAKAYASAQLPHVVPAATVDDLGNRTRYPHTFRMAPSNAQIAKTMLALMENRFKGATNKPKIWVVYDTGSDSANNKNLQEDFFKATKLQGLEPEPAIPLNLNSSPGALAQQEQVKTLVKNADPNSPAAVFVVASSSGVVNLAKALQEARNPLNSKANPLHPYLQLFAGVAADNVKLLKDDQGINNEDVEGLTLLSFFHPDMSSQPVIHLNQSGQAPTSLSAEQKSNINSFVKKFKACHAGAIPDARAAQAFDATQVILSRIKQGAISRTALFTALTGGIQNSGLLEKESPYSVNSTVRFNQGLTNDSLLVELQVQDARFVPQRIWHP
jgi:ABC-type branched-subunit amino acid transport system substrate-binding protein